MDGANEDRGPVGALGHLVSSIACGLVAAVLPAPERDEFAQRHRVRAPRWSFGFGLVEGALGLWIYMTGAIAYMSPLGGRQGLAVLEVAPESFPVESAIRLGGILTWFAYNLLSPVAWVSIMMSLTGLTRAVAFLASGEAVGEPLVLAWLRVVQALRRRRDAADVRLRYGPERADRAVVDDEHDLVVLSARRKPVWEDDVAIRVGDRFYRCVGREDRRQGPWWAHAYQLAELEPDEPLRVIEHCDAEPPEGLAPARTRRPGRTHLFLYGDEIGDPPGEVVTTAAARGFLLRFYGRRGEERGLPCAIPTGNVGDTVWGLVCEVDEEEARRILDDLGRGAWETAEEEVYGADGERYLVLLPRPTGEQVDRRAIPLRHVRDRIVAAGERHGFPEIYRALVASTPVREEGGPSAG